MWVCARVCEREEKHARNQSLKTNLGSVKK
jgi:hypothetical protein